MDLFKKSNKSICHNCRNINEKCSLVTKVCGTDSKIGYSFVQKCSKFNKDMSAVIQHKSNRIIVDNSADSRIEMMGGGFKEVRNGNKS